MRTWHKSIPMKMLHEKFGVYNGAWSQQMDRYWESDDGYTVSSRQIRTAIGVVEHVTIQKVGPGVRGGDIPWAVKQEIKDELFGSQPPQSRCFPQRRTWWTSWTSITSGSCPRTINCPLAFIQPGIRNVPPLSVVMTST